ncbi:DUF3024 domain-containing protein [Vibrio sp. HN007]|uniref:DUF3024 domain-containing protein n=1 Tax=Vibrio iocasae TaxID=3098914 RepID=UPI0035D43433
MKLSELELFRLERALLKFCQNRNRNVPAEMGKAQYEVVSDGVYFSKQCFLLDSSHINAIIPVAKLVYNAKMSRWRLKVAESKSGEMDQLEWYDYPHLNETKDYEEQLEELLHDPHNILW